MVRWDNKIKKDNSCMQASSYSSSPVIGGHIRLIFYAEKNIYLQLIYSVKTRHLGFLDTI